MSNIQNMNIAGQPIGTNYKPYIIAEMSANHNGSIDRAFKIIDEAKKAVQMRRNYKHILLTLLL